MALSGSVTTSTWSSTEGLGTRSYTLSWTATQSVTNNTSTISWTLKSSGTYPYTVAERTLVAVVAGTTVYSKTERVMREANTTVSTGSLTLSHGTDGTKSFTVSLQAAVYYSTVNCTGSATFTLNTISRASSISSASAVTLGNACGVTWTPNSSSYHYKLKFSLGNKSYTTGVISPSSTSAYTYTGYTMSIADYAPQITSSTTGTATVYLYTYSSSACTSQVGSASSKTFTVTVPSSVVPTISSASVAISNSNSTISSWGVCVAGYSKVTVTASASGSYSSTISSFTISGAYSATKTGTSLSYTGDTITSSGTKTFNVVAKDSRGRSSASKTAGTVTVYAYSKPSISSFKVSRSTSDSTKVIVKAVWSYASVNGKNSTTATLKYKKTSSSSWSTYSGTISQNSSTTLTTSFDETSSYDFQLIIKDSLSNSATSESTVSTIAVLLDFRAGGKGLGVGKIAETDSLEVAMESKFFQHIQTSNDVAIYGQDADGVYKECFMPCNANGNTVVGYGNYVDETGNTHIYGNDVVLYIASAGKKSFRPYYRAGDSTTVTIDTAGFLTTSGTTVCFTIPICKQAVGSPTVTVASTTGFILRQDNNYTHGSSSTVHVAPSSISATYGTVGIRVVATFENTENTTNNAPIGIKFIGTITFS